MAGYADASGQTGFVPTCKLHEFKKKLYEKIIHEKSDHKKWLEQRRFNKWLKQFGELRMGTAPVERKSNGFRISSFVNVLR